MMVNMNHNISLQQLLVLELSNNMKYHSILKIPQC